MVFHLRKHFPQFPLHLLSRNAKIELHECLYSAKQENTTDERTEKFRVPRRMDEMSEQNRNRGQYGPKRQKQNHSHQSGSNTMHPQGHRNHRALLVLRHLALRHGSKGIVPSKTHSFCDAKGIVFSPSAKIRISEQRIVHFRPQSLQNPLCRTIGLNREFLPRNDLRQDKQKLIHCPAPYP